MRAVLLFSIVFAIVFALDGAVDKKGEKLSDDMGFVPSRTLKSIVDDKQYEIIGKQMNWENAVIFCKERHGNLASIRSYDQWDLLKSVANQSIVLWNMRCPCNFWMGGTRQESDRDFYWVSDGESVLTTWGKTYPKRNRSQCMELRRHVGWEIRNEFDCESARLMPICEFY